MSKSVITSIAMVKVDELKYSILTVKTQGKKVISLDLSIPISKSHAKEEFKITASKSFFLKDMEYALPGKVSDIFPPDGGGAA